jgi:WD40 repeat protein
MKSRPPCLEWREKLALRHEDLSAADLQALDVHVSTCSTCATVLADYDYFEARLDALPPPSIKPLPRLLPQFFEQARVEHGKGKARSLLSAPASRRPVQGTNRAMALAWRVLGIAALVGLLLAASLIFRVAYQARLAAHPGGSTTLNLAQHTGAVYSVAWSPDGKYIATASEDHTVIIWNALSGGLVCVYSGHSDLVYAVAWSPDSRLVASGGSDNTVQIWNALTCSPATGYATYTASNPIASIAWSHRGSEIVSGGWNHEVQAWNVATGHVLWTFPIDAEVVQSVAWSPRDDQVAIGGWDSFVHILNAVTGTQLYSHRYSYNQAVNAVTWSPTGEYLAIGGDDTTVQIWNVQKDQIVFTYSGHTARVTAVAWSPDGQEIASGGDDKTVQVWNPFTGKLLMTYTQHTNTINSLAWSPDGKEIVSGSFDFTARVWKVAG